MTEVRLPRWQLHSIYPDGDATALDADRAALDTAVTELERYLDEHGVRAGGGTSAYGHHNVAILEGLLDRLERLYIPFATLQGYLSIRMAVDANDEDARSRLGALEASDARLQGLTARLTGWVGGLDVEALLLASPALREHSYLLRRTKLSAAHLMSEAAEELAAALDGPGGGAWETLHSDLVSIGTIEVALEPDQAARAYSIAELRIHQADPSETVRKRAMDAEVELLQRHRTSYAAAMNGIKGQVRELTQRRGWPSPLDAALFDCGIDRQSLDAMQSACVEHFPDLRRYLSAKARALGKERLGWHDLLAPIPGGGDRRFDWDEAKHFVLDRFGEFSAKLAGFAQCAFESDWLDAEPRAGKRNGAFCAALVRPQESRVMLNFGGRLDDVFTLAHELGHGYHNDCLFRFERGVLQADSPITLAETASIFCETLVLDGMLADADDAAQLAILEQDLLATTQLVIDIHSRFLFESAVFEARAERPLSADELDGLMLDAQRRTYGEGLTGDLRHPLMWAHKPHYYSSGTSFYNFPYTFGYLFGLGLFAVYQTDKAGFVDRYDTLLAGTGMASPAELAAGFGIDIRDPAFWRAGLDVSSRRVERFEALVERMNA